MTRNSQQKPFDEAEEKALQEAWEEHKAGMEHALRFHEGDHTLLINTSFDDGSFDAWAAGEL